MANEAHSDAGCETKQQQERGIIHPPLSDTLAREEQRSERRALMLPAKTARQNGLSFASGVGTAFGKDPPERVPRKCQTPPSAPLGTHLGQSAQIEPDSACQIGDEGVSKVRHLDHCPT
jgi:hypothetical protein